MLFVGLNNSGTGWDLKSLKACSRFNTLQEALLALWCYFTTSMALMLSTCAHLDILPPHCCCDALQSSHRMSPSLRPSFH